MSVQKRFPHIAALGFLSFLLLPVVSMLFLQGAQWYLKHTADKRLAEETIITISVPAATVHWEKKEKEILLNGKMFDIKSYRIIDGIFTAAGYYDEKETSIRKLLLSLPHDKAKNILLHFFLVLQCFTIVLTWLNELIVYRHSRKFHVVFTFFFPFFFLPIAEHPPQQEMKLFR